MTPLTPLRVVFMGTPSFAVPILQALANAGSLLVGVYSQPPRPKGRGYEVTFSPIHALAQSLGITVFTPPSLKTLEDQKTLNDLRPDVIVVAAYGLILPQAVLDIPPYGCINVHGSLLPRWRGAAPIQRALLAGDHETGIAIMRMEAGLDTGPVYRMAGFPIDGHDTATSLQDRLSHLGAQELLHILQQLQSGTCPLTTPQPEEGVTYAHKLTHEEGLLDWTQSAQVLDRNVRALNPWPGTFTYEADTRLKVLKAEPVSLTHAAQPGTLLDHQLLVACGSDALRITLLQKQGGKPLAAKDFLNGHPLAVGTLLKSNASL